jgi:hypothetical protein
VLCGRHSRGDGEVHVHLSSYKYTHFLPFPFFAPNSVVPPPLFVCCLTIVAHRDKVSLDHPLPSVLIKSCLSVLLPIILTPHSHHESPRHLLVSRLFKTHSPQTIPRPSCSTTFNSLPDTRPASILTQCHRCVHSPSQPSPPTNLLFQRTQVPLDHPPHDKCAAPQAPFAKKVPAGSSVAQVVSNLTVRLSVRIQSEMRRLLSLLL